MVEVSVIIPTHNRPRFLHVALTSILRQTLGDFEVLVVDDGSDPPVRSVVERLNDPRLRYFYQEQCGRSYARNRGLRQATGEYVALLDDDDWFLEDKLALQVEYLRNNPNVDLVSGGVQTADERGNVTGLEEGWLSQPKLRLPEALYSLPLLTCAVLFRRGLLMAVDTWFDPRASLAEDTDFWLRALAAGCRFEWQPEIVAVRRQHPGNSQANRQAYGEAYDYVFDKFFVSESLPTHLRRKRDQVLGHYALISALEAYQVGDYKTGANGLLKSLELRPSHKADDAELLARAIASYANAKVRDDPTGFIDRVFDQLPEGTGQLVSYRRHAQSARYMDKVMKAVRRDQRPALTDWLQAVWIDPAWLTQRFSWAALLHALSLR